MIICTKCGCELPEDSLFCKKCGSPVSEPGNEGKQTPENVQVNCTNCGNLLTADAKFCNKCGASYGNSIQTKNTSQYDEMVRCTQCGEVIGNGAGYCKACGCKAPSHEEYTSLTSRIKLARDMKRHHGGWMPALIIPLTIVLIIAALIFWLDYSYSNDEFRDFSNNVLPWLFFGSLIGFPVMTFIIWGTSRSKAFKRTRMPHAEYRQLLSQYKELPKMFFAPLPGPAGLPAQPAIPDLKTEPPKKKMSAAGAFMISIVALFFVYVGVINVIFPGDAVFGSLSTVFGSENQSIDGRWEGASSSSSGGMTTESNVAIYFSGGKAYIGDSAFSNSELRSGYAQSIASYSVGNGKIKLKTNGISKSYNYDGKYIYMGSIKLHKVG